MHPSVQQLTSYPPPGLPPSELFQERQIFLTIALHALSYGIHLSIGTATLYFTLRAPSSGRVSWPLAILIAALLVCGTIEAGTTIKAGIMTFIDNRGFPGGPAAYYVAEYSDPVETIGNIAYVIANLLADGALIYRLNVVWNGNWIVLILPCLTYLAVTALSILSLYQSAKPGASLWSQSAISVLLPYWALGIANNVFITLLIVYRILSLRHSMSKVLGSDHLKIYVSVSAILIESAALYSVIGIVFIILYAINNPVQNPILAIMDQVICIAPELIVLRVVLGRAWSKETTTAVVSRRPVKMSNILTSRENDSRTLANNVSDSALGEVYKLSEIRTGEHSV